MVLSRLSNGLSTFFIKDNPVFSNGPKSLPKNLPDCLILCNWIFCNFILADEPFLKALRSVETCVLVNNNLCGKPFSSLELPTTFDKSFKVSSSSTALQKKHVILFFQLKNLQKI